MNHTVGRRDLFAWFLSLAGVLVLFSTEGVAQPADPPDDDVPQNFALEGEKSPAMEIHDPLITADEVKMFLQRKQSSYNRALRDGELTSENVQLIEEGIKVRMLAMTLPEYRQNTTVMRNSLMRDIKSHAGRNEINPRLKRRFREMVLEEVLKNARLMMKNHQTARVFAISVVKDLNIVEEDRRNQIPAEPYEPALEFMREVVNDPEQVEAVKIIALQGIKRILESTQVKISRNDLLQTAEDLAKELKDSGTHYWMQQKLISTLRATQIDVNRAGEPFIVEGLLEVMADPERHPLVRSEAAYSIPRLPLANNVNLGLVAWQIAKLTENLAIKYNQEPDHFWWQAAFFRLYAAFRPVHEGDEALLMPDEPLNERTRPVDAAYQQSLPVMKAVFNNRGGARIEPATIVPLSDWLKANAPGDYDSDTTPVSSNNPIAP